MNWRVGNGCINWLPSVEKIMNWRVLSNAVECRVWWKFCPLSGKNLSCVRLFIVYNVISWAEIFYSVNRLLTGCRLVASTGRSNGQRTRSISSGHRYIFAPFISFCPLAHFHLAKPLLFSFFTLTMLTIMLEQWRKVITILQVPSVLPSSRIKVKQSRYRPGVAQRVPGS